jgi:lysophospholipase L1-like esterase
MTKQSIKPFYLCIALTITTVFSLTTVAKAPPNPKTPITPATQPGNGYGWMDRHNAILKIKNDLNPDLVFIGDSITHHWGGLPEGRLKLGEKILKSAFSQYRVLNLGFGSDRTQHALWRLDNGELDNLHPKWVVINIGTNNTSDGNSADEITAGVEAVCQRVRKITPEAKIILMAIFPRDQKPDAPRRKLINQINSLLSDYAQQNKITFLDIGAKFLDETGNIQKTLLPDFCHPHDQGYQIWADALKPLLQ